MRNAVIYVRQSRHKPTERTVSPEVQRQACFELAAVAACDTVEAVKDLDISGGKTKERRGYQDLLERVCAGTIDVVAA
jgi:DNA invertase Pin-like site-specific DNA recombinase